MHINFRTAALFLDFDGTLVEFAERPDAVFVSPELRQLLVGFARKLDGALALVSGRSIESLDKLLGLPEIPVAGGHGAEWRLNGAHQNVQLDSPNFHLAVERITHFADKHGLLTEHKRHSFALHFRDQPELKESVDKFVAANIEILHGLRVIYGNCVREIQPLGMDKGKAVERFMKIPPFSGRLPIYVGDDTTDEDAFRWVNDNWGVTFKVGSGVTAAQHRLESVAAVMQFLRDANQLS